MTLEIHEPELEALIDKRMATGVFETIEDALLQALRSAPPPEDFDLKSGSTPKSGLAIFEALQRCPHPVLNPWEEQP